MTQAISREEIIKKLDYRGAICSDRLYPARLFALQLFTNKDIDRMINDVIIYSLTKICEYDGDKEQFKFDFDKSKLFIKQEELAEMATDYITQFIKDFKVFGLREAVVWLHKAEFIRDPAKTIDNAINLVTEITKLYLENKSELLKSKDEKIQRLLMTLKLYET